MGRYVFAAIFLLSQLPFIAALAVGALIMGAIHKTAALIRRVRALRPR